MGKLKLETTCNGRRLSKMTPEERERSFHKRAGRTTGGLDWRRNKSFWLRSSFGNRFLIVGSFFTEMAHLGELKRIG